MNHFPRHLPLRAFLLSMAALAVPVTVAFIQPEWLAGDQSLLIWMTPLVPAFLLTYYKGWAGASLALAAGMAALSLTQVILLVTGARAPAWGVLLGMVVVYLGVTLGVGWMAELLHRERRVAQEMALTDALTGLANRRHAEVFLEAAHAGSARGIPTAVVLFDLDRFKSFNDRFGHAAGDRALTAVSRALDAHTRKMNLSARYGGEEFLSILVNCDAEGARIFTNRVREALADELVAPEPVTVSAGIAECLDGEGSPDILLATADRALYRAKQSGRDRVVVASELEDDAPAADAGSLDERPRVDPTPPSRNPTVLVVDDDPVVLETVSRMLDRLGFNPLPTPSPTAALATVRKGHPRVDLLLTDVAMPEMSGFTLVEEIMRFRPDLPVLYMSGYAHDHLRDPRTPGHSTSFLKKPLDLGELGREARTLLEVPPHRPGATSRDGAAS